MRGDHKRKKLGTWQKEVGFFSC